MNINGLQKLTLLDFPGKVACTVFFAGCNLRCPFCHNGSLVLDPAGADKIPTEELLSFLKGRKGLLDGVCITGGEPLLQPQILTLMEQIKDLGYAVKLDTNGTRPEVLDEILSRQLADYVAMDIKSSREGYPKAVGIEDFDLSPINRSIDLLIHSGIPFEFRTTLVKSVHTEDDIRSIGRWIGGDHPYFLQNFVDSGDLIDPASVGFTPDEMAQLAAVARKYLPHAQVRGL